MVVSYRKWLDRLRFLTLFIALTLALYHVMTWLDGWLEPRDKYREPHNQAVKAFRHAALPSERGTVGERLRLFYWYGE
ncbi:hypothetical protein SD70_31115 [Gordoniibacillus kamchatkensis]|uniref:DUF4227 domain-containing protein n=1 Tax=Gordoniibacillus kamchatkensis TaxID=1590651 RepID=A0ABR5A7R8_9BACL|nr:DUF4227 family protein [Paenibacillus sp. VKM B-2647]KIL37074.1 hypothetical protein SD70_31115 [Paenibacillus sp. VKM B-2647]